MFARTLWASVRLSISWSNFTFVIRSVCTNNISPRWCVTGWMHINSNHIKDVKRLCGQTTTQQSRTFRQRLNESIHRTYHIWILLHWTIVHALCKRQRIRYLIRKASVGNYPLFYVVRILTAMQHEHLDTIRTETFGFVTQYVCIQCKQRKNPATWYFRLDINLFFCRAHQRPLAELINMSFE